MASTYTVLAVRNEAELIVEWFRELSEPPTESRHAQGVLFYFSGFGPLLEDAKSSPLVNVFMPVKRREALTSAAEIHFLSVPMSRFPGLYKINLAFRKWLSQFELVYSQKPAFEGQYNYYLEGQLMNTAPEIFAFPQALGALDRGEYFVRIFDDDYVLEVLAKKLRLRGVQGL